MTTPTCKTCSDYHYLCEGRVPCDNTKHWAYEMNRFPPEKKHNWKPCPDCQSAVIATTTTCDKVGCLVDHSTVIEQTAPAVASTSEEWELAFDTKWFETEKVSQTLNQHRWMMKDFVRETRRQAAREAAAKIVRQVKKSSLCICGETRVVINGECEFHKGSWNSLLYARDEERRINGEGK